MFYDGVKKSDLDSRAHILKHLHGRVVFVPFEKAFREGTLCSGYRAIISFILTKQIFLRFYCHANQFYDRYLNLVKKLNILMMMVLVRNQNCNFKVY